MEILTETDTKIMHLVCATGRGWHHPEDAIASLAEALQLSRHTVLTRVWALQHLGFIRHNGSRGRGKQAKSIWPAKRGREEYQKKLIAGWMPTQFASLDLDKS